MFAMAEATGNDDAAAGNHGHLHLPAYATPVSSESSHHGDDLISVLPEEILHNILSFLPTRYAIRTTVLSKRWRSVWSHTPSLSFDDLELSADSIDRTLALHASPNLRTFSLRVDLNYRLSASCVERWIQFAMSRHASELCLSIRSPQVTDNYELPQFLYDSSTLIKLSLELSLYVLALLRGFQVSWPFLRSLSLRFCVLNDESISRVLSGCPMLEFLKLDSCVGICRLDLENSNCLRDLVIQSSNIAFRGPAEILAPHLQSLTLKGYAYECRLSDVSSLIEANITDWFCGHKLESHVINDLQVMLLELLGKLQNVEKLSLGTSAIQILSVVELKDLVCAMVKCKHLTLETMICKWILPGLARLLQNSPDLKTLTIRIATSVELPAKCLDDLFSDSHEWMEEECWVSKESIFMCLSDTLKMVKAESEGKATKPKLLISLMEFILRNTRKLEKLVVKVGTYVPASELEELSEIFTRKLSNYSAAQILVEV